MELQYLDPSLVDTRLSSALPAPGDLIIIDVYCRSEQPGVRPSKGGTESQELLDIYYFCMSEQLAALMLNTCKISIIITLCFLFFAFTFRNGEDTIK